MTSGLYTNTNLRKDFLRPRLLEIRSNVKDVFIASAFFTDADVILSLERADCTVRLIVRLGFPTSPSELARIIGRPSIQIRYFTSEAFHPKLYIFGDNEALVGSANLTKAALTSNQEVVVSIGATDTRFADLAAVFSEYWSSAAVLTEVVLERYRAIYARYGEIGKHIDQLNRSIQSQIGNVVCHNIGRDEAVRDGENIFLDSYRKTYQETISAFHRVADVYTSVGKRKVPEDLVPLRLEIDSFLSFVREVHTAGDDWMDTPLGWNTERALSVEAYVREWHNTAWPYLENTIVKDTYPRLTKTFSSPENVMSSSDDELFDALQTVHSFRERLRFFEGGLKGLKAAFFGSNNGANLRANLAHLIFGKGDLVRRMADLLYDPKFKINEFGQSNVQELVGWINSDNVPVINGRTTKVLRFLGLDVRQL